MQRYADLEVIVQQMAAGGHAVDLRFRADPGDLDRDLALNVPITITLAALLETLDDAERYGATLAQMVFGDQRLREGWITARASAEARDLPLRIRLRIDPRDAELHAIRWELIHDDQGIAVARSERFLLSRYLDSADLGRVAVPLREQIVALLVAASPHNLAEFGLSPFDAEAEVARVQAALADLPSATLTSTTGGPVTLEAITDALRYGSYNLLYLVCHGQVRNGVAYLALEDESGAVVWVPGDRLVERMRDLAGERRPSLIVIGSCQSVGLSHGSGVPAALGPQLARAGVAAVIGMQGNVPFQTVARLMPRFFRQLSEDGQIDRALAAARSGLRSDEPWWMPVLFMRMRDGQLWREQPQLLQEASALTETATGLEPRPRKRPLWLAGVLGMVVLLLMIGGLAWSQRRNAAAPLPQPTAFANQAAPSAPSIPRASPTSVIALSPIPLPSPVPTVVPVAAGQELVLVADLEGQSPTGRDLTREIVEDLQLNLEQLPFSNLVIRRLNRVISSADEAEAAATATEAAVVVWGRNNAGRIELTVQSGDLGPLTTLPPQIDAATIRRTASLPLRIETNGDVRASAALGVLAALNVRYTANSDSFSVLRLATMQDRLQGQIVPAEAVGQSSAVRAYQFVRDYYNPDLRPALVDLDRGLTDDPSNPILYIYRATVYQRLGDLRAASEDAQAALALAPNWSTGEALLAALAGAQGDFATAQTAFTQALEQRPNDWLLHSYRGGMSYLLGDYAATRADIAMALEHNPQTALPYSFALSTALREGQIDEARQLVAELGLRFSGQRGFDSSFYRGTFGSETPVHTIVAAFELLLGQQFGQAARVASEGLVLAEQLGYPETSKTDLYFILGLIACFQGEYASAAEAYTAVLERAPDFSLVHLLRAEARLALGDVAGAQADLTAAATSPQAPQLRPLLNEAQNGTLSCRSLLSGGRP